METTARHPRPLLRVLLRRSLINRARRDWPAEGPPDEGTIAGAVDTALAGVDESANPIIDWLTGEAFMDLLRLVLELIVMFRAEHSFATAAPTVDVPPPVL